MTDARQTPPSVEEQMLKHIRQHSVGEPPASLDALILASARRELPKPAPSLWQRWLQACQKPRLQMAFASLFGVALILVLVQRSPDHYPTPTMAPAPAPAPASAPIAPMARQMAEPAPAELAERVPEPMVQGAMSAPAPRPAASMGGLSASPAAREYSDQTQMLSDEASAQVAKPMADQAKGKPMLSKRAAVPLRSVDDELREVLRLREAGQVKEADQRLEALHKRYPQLDVQARLQDLQRP